MIYLIIGSPDSGKSKRAEAITMELSDGGGRYYIATMIPYGEEGKRRIQRHRSLREGKDFITIERPYDIHMTDFPKEADAVLVECISNLVANELFERGTKADTIPELVKNQIKELAQKTRHLVIVSNRFPLEAEGYDQATICYVKTIDRVNQELIKLADKTEEIINEHT